MTELPTDYDGHVMRTPDEWCRIKQIQILDPDGWRGYDAKDWSEPLTELDFEERAQVCTQRSTAGEHHTGTLNLTGEGNVPASPISDELAETAAEHMTSVARIYYGPQVDAPHMARKFARAALEAAYPAIRQQVAEEIAAAIEAMSGDYMPGGHTYVVQPDAARQAREIGAQG